MTFSEHRAQRHRTALESIAGMTAGCASAVAMRGMARDALVRTLAEANQDAMLASDNGSHPKGENGEAG